MMPLGFLHNIKIEDSISEGLHTRQILIGSPKGARNTKDFRILRYRFITSLRPKLPLSWKVKEFAVPPFQEQYKTKYMNQIIEKTK